MPTVSDKLEKLSTSMTQLSERAKEAEEQTTAARDEAHEELEQRIARARDAAQQRRRDLESHAAEVKDDVAKAWAGLRAHVRDQIEKIRAKVDEKRNDHDVTVAGHRADRAERNAADAIDFALWAIDEAEAAVLEAVDAREISDRLQSAIPSAR